MSTDPPGEQPMAGGVNQVTRVGDTVRRPVGAWTATVHRLLDHVTRSGFTGAPRAHGIDESGREILDFLAGEVPGSDHVPQEENLAATGALLSAYHDATRGFQRRPDDTWYLRPQEPDEVICHGDVAPYNTVFHGGVPVAFIDFDTAHPGPRVADVAYAAYRFVPLSAEAGPVVELGHRLRVFADGYRLASADRRLLVDAAADRLRDLVHHMHTQAAEGNAAFAGHIAQGHDQLYDRDRAFLHRHRDSLATALATGR